MAVTWSVNTGGKILLKKIVWQSSCQRFGTGFPKIGQSVGQITWSASNRLDTVGGGFLLSGFLFTSTILAFSSTVLAFSSSSTTGFSSTTISFSFSSSSFWSLISSPRGFLSDSLIGSVFSLFSDSSGSLASSEKQHKNEIEICALGGIH